MKKIPFVITEDIRSVTRKMPIKIPEEIFVNVSNKINEICLNYITPNVILLKEKEMTEWIARVTSSNSLFQTNTYTDLVPEPIKNLQVTRTIQWQKTEAEYLPRKGFGFDVKNVFDNIEQGEYTLVDDVIFTGQGSKELIILGQENGVKISKVIACVTIGMGVELLSKINVETESLFHFDEVIDEVCLRDFIPGLPFSGRAYIHNSRLFPFSSENFIKNETKNTYHFIPYLLPWGKPENSMSVPIENIQNFSIECLKVAIEFWYHVAPQIKIHEVPAPVFDTRKLPKRTLFVDYLKSSLRLLETK